MRTITQWRRTCQITTILAFVGFGYLFCTHCRSAEKAAAVMICFCSRRQVCIFNPSDQIAG